MGPVALAKSYLLSFSWELLNGLSTRVNGDLIYMMMYDSYYIGMQETLMDSMQKVEITDLLKSEINDEYNFIVGRASSLTDLMSNFCSIIGKLVSILSLLVVALTSSKIVFVISLIYVVSVLILNFSFTEKIRSNEQKIRKDNRAASYLEKLPHNAGTAKEIRIFENTEDVVKQWRKAFGRVMANKIQNVFDVELRNFVSGSGFYLFLIVMMVYSLYGVAKGNVSPSVFIMLYLLCMNMYSAISGLARNTIRFDYGLFALERQRAFFHIASFREKSEGRQASLLEEQTPVFDVENLSFGYSKQSPAIKNVCFQVKKGEIIALVGKNGSGKTTLTKLLLGMYKPNSGTMKLFGRHYSDYSSEEIRHHIGVFFQDFYLFHASLLENVAYGDIESANNEEKMMDAIKKGGAEKLLRKLPAGIHTLLGKQVDKSGVELSGGEKQRIVVSRAHMSNKNVLIFDEPSAALDPIAELEQFNNIREKLNGRTAILISHRVGFARLADKIMMMDEGKIAEIGTHDELILQGGLYADFFYQQAQWYEDEALAGRVRNDHHR
jgi:ATP-binding cassette subfamily B protein